MASAPLSPCLLRCASGTRGVRLCSAAMCIPNQPLPRPFPRARARPHRLSLRSARQRPVRLRCPLPLPAGALISYRSAKIPIPTPSPASLPPPAPGGGLKCILDDCAVSGPCPAPSPALAPGRPRPLLLRRMGRDLPDSSVCPLPLPAGASNHIILSEKCLSSVRHTPTSCARFFFLCAGVRRVPWLLRRQGPRRASAQRFAGCAYHAII